jgi:hypothetical protein
LGLDNTNNVAPLSATSVNVGQTQSTVTPVAKPSQAHSQHQLHTSDVDITQSVIQVDDQSCFQSFIQLGLRDDGIGNYASMPSPDDEDAEPDPVMNDLNDDSEMTSGQCRSLPEWLTELVAEKLEFLKQTDSQGCPTLYSKFGTFWLPHKCGWFNMFSSKKLKPELLYNPQFFYWDPMHLVEISCPHCKAKLKRHGTAYNRPRECFNVNGSFWIIGARYRCPDCITQKVEKSPRHS